jgi:hypothetical protein
MQNTARVPLKPDYSLSTARSSRNATTLFRAATVLALCEATKRKRTLDEVLQRHYPNEKNYLGAVIKGVTGAATTIGSGWAADQLGMTVADAVTIFAPASAARTLLPLCMQLAFDATGIIVAPYGTGDATSATFIQENAPIPVRAYALSTGPQLTPRKLASISVFTRETFLHSTAAAEQTVRAKVTEDFGLAIDKYLFDNVAGDLIRPAGLRANISTSAASGSAVRAEAMAADIATLVAAVAPVAGNNEIIFIASTAQATALKLWNNPRFDCRVLASGGLSAGLVIALAPNTLMSASALVPRFDLSSEATLHFEDATPRDIDTTAVSQTVKSLYQSDLIGLRTILDISWALRNPAGLAWTSVNW